MENEALKGVDYTGITVVYWAHDGNGKFFMSERSEKCRNNHHQWECGGSALQFGESPTEGISRTLKKEIGVQNFQIDESLPPLSHTYESERGREHWVGLPHIVKINPTDVVVQEVDMVENSGWFSLEELPTPLDHGTSAELQHYKLALEKYGK